MDLAKAVEIQLQFSKEKFPRFWNIESEVDKALRLEYLSNALAGEVGEFANLVKKVVRGVVYGVGDFDLERAKSKLAEELIDVFIYTLTIAGLLEIDIEGEFIKKLEKNRKRF
ncbi:MAG: MazG nucleotide pyrophosphohydrolase domain-containing protein [Pyrobaculum sp.]